jgi:ABC-type transport system involved in multi-copper enzyme maturation permease subunit
MIRFQQVSVIARAEARLTRRLARYWVFLSLSYLIVLVAYFQYSFLHGLYSTYTATAGAMSPRFMVGGIGVFYLPLYAVGAVFLAFDVRARDVRERMSEVLDSRFYTNLELVAGRFMGLLTASWIPVVVLAVILELVGFLLVLLGSPIGEPLNITSLISFVFLMALPALSFILALVFLVTLLVRNRLASAILVFVLVGGAIWVNMKLPMAYNSLTDVVGFHTLNLDFSSDIIPCIPPLDGWLQRFSLLLAVFGMLGFAAAVHPRLDGGSRAKLSSGASGMIVLAILFSGFLYFNKAADFRMAETWRAAHGARADDSVPDVTSISGNVIIDPGRSLGMEVDVSFRAPGREGLESALFTLNPGQKVTSAVDASGRALAFTHENGLLDITLPASLPPGGEATVHLSIEGVPDKRFSYLESAIDVERIKSTGGGGSIRLLGIEPAIFNRRFVALMPGVRWLPTSGGETGRDDPGARPVDLFTVDLTVELPDGWLAAGPGRRQPVGEAGGNDRFRFSPGAPVPEVALIASRFESRSIEVEGVTMELLLYPKHTKNLASLADAGDKIFTWIEDRLKDAEAGGLGYPYDGLSLVEVPNGLRGYGGGWRMDSVMAPPGLLLMKENSFPIARFDTAFRKPEKFEDQEGGIVQAKLDRLNTFFQADFSGGNIFTGASRNFLVYQAAAGGQEALALNFVIENLSSRLATETTGYFSAHLFADDKSRGEMINSTISTYQIEQHLGTSVVDAALGSAAAVPGLWDKMLEVSLEEMDPWEDPARTVDILALKGNAVARSILDTLGREDTVRLLSLLRQTHQGGSYGFEDFQAAAEALGYDMEVLLGDWFGSAALPGFVCDETSAFRLPDSEDGSPRYQLLFTVRNDEPVPGLFRFIRRYNNEGGPGESMTSDSIRMDGKSIIRYGLVVSRPPSIVLLDPYLSLNRMKFGIQLPSIDAEKIEKVDAVTGAHELPWAPLEESFVVVDDLDPGFRVLEGEGQGKGLRIDARGEADEDTDQGLPSRRFTYRIPSTWSRISLPQFYGRYRHTMVAVKAGKGEKKAVFTAAIPRGGQWDLEVYMSPGRGMIYPGRKWGTWHFTVTDANGDERRIAFDSDVVSEGWNPAGNFDLPEGEVSVTLSNETDGKFVVADAIRWVPAGGNYKLSQNKSNTR